MTTAARIRDHGRVTRIYSWLRANPQAHTIAEIHAATNPDGELQVTSNTLSSMARNAFAVRTGGGRGTTRYRAGDHAPKTWKDPTAVAAPVSAPRTVALSSSRAPSHDQQRAQIAADVAAFEARGGRIQRLGVTQLFRQTRAAND